MAKQLNVNLAFTADTKAAQAQLKQLQQQLDNVMNPKNLNMSSGFTAEIQKGIAAASELKVKLMDATNVNTGKLDLTKFSQSLKKSNRELEDYANDLAALGPQGSEAFLSVARAISNAETPFLRLNNRANEFLTTLKNTARWQISSSILHGFMGTMQKAYGYAQDLNKSLNNIRIVTGKSAEDMARFAKNANAAARNLSATTLDYTDASLIYYQQGLDDKQVAARTDTTIKLANVSRQSAEEVSDQMTAIWNNFYNGSKSIEYYADVITALGATTASSSEEIATGLEKFSAVAKTVGLSYEYATSALATITAQTRQSADTVGTGLRTLFARLESVNLGETLEDGVTLTKYTQALDKIGVSVLDQNGQLKSMDTILDSIAEKWSTLDETTKTATANTVGGVRQYATFLALMNNWDKMQANLGVARGSSGTLQEQADIYAESWEAARKRVQASAEAIYDALLNDKFFINLTKALSTILDGFNGIIKSAGGLRGVLLGLGAILSRVFSNQLSSSISNIMFGASQLTKSGRQQAEEMKSKAWNIASTLSLDTASQEGAARSQAIQEETAAQQRLVKEAANMTEEERKIYQIRLDNMRLMQDEYIEQAKQVDSLREEEGTLIRIAKAKVGKENRDLVGQYVEANRDLGALTGQTAPILKFLSTINVETEKDIKTVQDLQNKISTLSPEGAALLSEKFAELGPNTQLSEAVIGELQTVIEELLQNATDDVEILGRAFGKKLPEEVKKAGQVAQDTSYKQERLNQTLTEGARRANDLANGPLPNLSSKYDKLAQSITKAAQIMSSIGFIINNITNIINQTKDALEDGSITLNELLPIFTSLAMTIGMIIPVITTIKTSLIPTLAKWTASQLSVTGAIAVTEVTLLDFLAVIAPCAITIGVLVGAGILLYQTIYKDEIAAKNAAKEYENLKTAAEKASESYDSLKTNLNNYEDALKGLDGLTTGTEAWANAIADVDAAYQKLKEENPEFVANARTTIKNGQIVFEDAEEAIASASANANSANISAHIGEYNKFYTQSIVDNKQTALKKELMGLGVSSNTDALVQMLQGARDTYSINSAVEQFIQQYGLSESDAATLRTHFNSKSTQNKVIEYNNQVASNTNGLHTAAQQLALDYLGTGYSDADRNDFAKLIASRPPEEITEDWLATMAAAYQPAVSFGKEMVKTTQDQLGELEGLKSLLGNKDLTPEQLASSTFDWSQLGTTAAGFAGMTDTEQQQRLLDYEMQLKEAYFAEAEAKLLTLSAEEQRAKADELAVERAIYEKQLIQDLASAYGLNAEEIDSLTDYYEQYAATNENVADTLQDNRSEALKVAAINTRLNKGVKELGDNWENYAEILKESKKDSTDYQRTLTQLRKHLDDVLNIDSKVLSEGFFDESTGNLELMRKAAEGDTEAIEQLRAAAANDIVQQVTARIDDENLKSQVNDLNDYLTSYADLQDLKIGANLDNSQFLDACNEMIKASGMTALEASNYFKALGYDAEVVEDQNVSESTIVTDGKWFDARTGETKRLNNITATTTTTTTVPVVKAITYTGSAGGTVNYSNKKGKGSGGGGSTKKTKNATDEIDRYHVIKEVIRDLTAEYDKINKTKDRAFGANRINAINGEISATNKLIAAQKQYIKEIQDYLVSDSGNLASGILSYTGIEANIQGGILQNYEEVMNAAISRFNADKSETADENYENFKKLISTYEETFALFDTAEAELTDLINRNQDARYERLNHIVEIKVKVNEANLKRIETDIKLLGDSVYKAVERLSYAWNQGNNDNTRYGNIVQQIDTYNYQLDELNKLYAEGKISQSDYMDGLDSVRNSFYSQLEALMALDEEMRTYYSTTLKEASAEVQFWNTQLDNATKALDHYKKIVELSGYGGDYARMGVLLEGQLQTKTNRYNSSKQWYDDLVNERERVMGQLYAAQSAGDIELVRRLQDKLKAIVEETANAEEQMFSDLEAVMEAIKAITENTINKIHKDIEDKLTKGYGFDYLKNALSQLSEIQEQYLTKTNQVYETTKFLRQINQDMDKTDNAASKLKLQNFMSQVEQLKEQNKLSKLDLDIAKARYEVLLAQIALEDAQNAKSVVRLSRDSEGNYGYVYTADPDKINDAEQKLADKQNDLYNLVLNAYNENTQKLMDIYKDAEEQLAELQDLYYNQHAISTEMYEKKKQEIIQRYNDASFIYLQNIDTVRNVLNEVALTDYTEAFASAYNDIYLNIEDYDTAILESTEQTEAAYERQVEALAKYAVPIIGESLDDLEKKTQNVTDASDELANTIENELEPALIDQVSNINDITYAYELQRDAILNIIDAIREQIRAIDALYEAEGRAVLEEANQEAEANETIGDSITKLANDIQVGTAKANGTPTPKGTPDLDDTSTDETKEGFIIVKPGVESQKNNDYYVTSGGNINPAKLQKLQIKKYAFATGGYTGEWEDSSGRLALLHQKELVLNQEDTENILQAVDIIRQITSAIDLNAASVAAGLGYISSPAFGSTGSTLDQNVHIDATFPNVTDHNEIEQALSSLVNRAAQFANRK